MPDPTDAALETNAYAISYRLLGDRPSARAVAGIAAQRVRQAGGLQRPDWLHLLVQATLEQTLSPATPIPPEDTDAFASLRAALRRRLDRASPDERVAGCLLHLSGYPADFVAQVMGRDVPTTLELAGVVAPPPGVAYRDLGDPELTHRVVDPAPRRRRRRPHWTTLAAVAIVVAAVIAATQVTGPRPTLGPPSEEGGLGLTSEQHGAGDEQAGTADEQEGAAVGQEGELEDLSGTVGR